MSDGWERRRRQRIRRLEKAMTYADDMDYDFDLIRSHALPVWLWASRVPRVAGSFRAFLFADRND